MQLMACSYNYCLFSYSCFTYFRQKVGKELGILHTNDVNSNNTKETPYTPFTLTVTLSSYLFPSTSVTLHVNMAPFSPVVLASMVNVRCWLYDFSKESSTPTRNHSIIVEFRWVEQLISPVRSTMNGFSWPRISTATRDKYIRITILTNPISKSLYL